MHMVSMCTLYRRPKLVFTSGTIEPRLHLEAITLTARQRLTKTKVISSKWKAGDERIVSRSCLGQRFDDKEGNVIPRPFTIRPL
jgi:hypothetical protein